MQNPSKIASQIDEINAFRDAISQVGNGNINAPVNVENINLNFSPPAPPLLNI